MAYPPVFLCVLYPFGWEAFRGKQSFVIQHKGELP